MNATDWQIIRFEDDNGFFEDKQIVEYRWNGSLSVNVYVGYSVNNGHNVVTTVNEIDFITLGQEATYENFAEAAKEHFEDFVDGIAEEAGMNSGQWA